MDLNHYTVVDWNNDLREVFKSSLLTRKSGIIGGPKEILEINKSLLKAKKIKAVKFLFDNGCLKGYYEKLMNIL